MKRRDAIDNFNLRFGRMVEKMAISACDGDEQKALMVMRTGLMTFSQRIVDAEILALRRRIGSIQQEMAEARRDFETMGRLQIRRGVAQMVYDAPFTLVPLSTPIEKWQDPETIAATKNLYDDLGLFKTQFEEFSGEELDEEVE